MESVDPNDGAIRQGDPPYRIRSDCRGDGAMRRSVLIAVTLQAATVGLGYLCGVAFPLRSPAVYAACALVAGLLMIIGALHSPDNVTAARMRHSRTVCIASLLYSAGVVFWDPFFRVQRTDEAVLVALILAPLLLAAGYLVRAKAWVSVTGVSVFVFISMVMIASNANTSVSGSGFFGTWIS